MESSIIGRSAAYLRNSRCAFARPQTTWQRSYASPTTSLTRPFAKAQSPCSPYLRRRYRHANFQPDPQPPRFWQQWWHSHPILLSVVVLSLGGGTFFYYKVRASQRKIDAELGPYPVKVGRKLRSARYHTDFEEDGERAIKDYLASLKLAIEANMDPLSDEVLGMKIEIARGLAKFRDPSDGSGLLESAKSMCLERIKELPTSENKAYERQRLLLWAIRFAMNLYYIYSSPNGKHDDAAFRNLEWAVTTGLQSGGAKGQYGVGEIDPKAWLSRAEIGSMLEDFAEWHHQRDRPDLAMPLYLQALNYKSTVDCHAATLMNNLAVAIWGYQQEHFPPDAAVSKEEIQEQAQLWADHAEAIARETKSPQRTHECDLAYIVAIINRGDFALSKGNKSLAREKFKEAGSLAYAVGSEDLVNTADRGLRELDSPP